MNAQERLLAEFADGSVGRMWSSSQVADVIRAYLPAIADEARFWDGESPIPVSQYVAVTIYAEREDYEVRVAGWYVDGYSNTMHWYDAAATSSQCGRQYVGPRTVPPDLEFGKPGKYHGCILCRRVKDVPGEPPKKVEEAWVHRPRLVHRGGTGS